MERNKARNSRICDVESSIPEHFALSTSSDATCCKLSVRAENPWDRRALRFRAL